MTEQGQTRRYIQGHNRRGKGKGWIECGYKYISVNGKKIAEHRHIVEQREGRKLTSDEVVHHVDGNKFNNASENLLVVTRGEHRRLHSGTKWKRWTQDEKQRARQLHEAGLSTQDVARVMRRSVSSTTTYVCNRRNRHG